MPLSLHRNLDSVAVRIPTHQIDDFDLEWTKVEGYRHWKGWGNYELGEADSLAEKAFRSVGKYQTKTLRKAAPRKADGSIEKWFEPQAEAESLFMLLYP